MRIKTRYNKRTKKNTLFSRKRSIAFFVFSLACLLMIIAFLIVLDNMRVVVKNEKLAIPAMPSDLEGYSLLHISDLHGQYFGAEHVTLTDSLKGRKYNIVLVTGDLIDSACDLDDPQKQSVIDLFTFFADEGKQVYYVLGNHDEPIVSYLRDGSVIENEFYLRLADTGAILLDAPEQIPIGRNGYSLWLWPLGVVGLSYDEAVLMLEDGLDSDDLSYSQSLQKKQYEALVRATDNTQPRDVSIALAHYPLTPKRLADINEQIPEYSQALEKINLVLAGHFHGGQMRIPFFGPVFVSSTTLGNNGFFPPSEYVMGMMNISGVRQHVSGGLGSTGVGGTKLLKFRLFCPPEISIISLTSSLAG